MQLRLAGLVITAALFALSAGSAQAASLSVTSPCLRATLPAGDMTITGTGFAPSSQILLYSGTTTPTPQTSIFDSSATDASGTFSVKFTIPAPPESGKSINEAQFTIAASDSAFTIASVTFDTTRLFADYKLGPAARDPQKQKVRFSAFGFGAGLAAGAPAPPIYIHYITPRGKLKQTVLLGSGTGPCGSITKTALKRLFPFALTRGTWALQFDTRKGFTRGKITSRFLWHRLTVTLS